MSLILCNKDTSVHPMYDHNCYSVWCTDHDLVSHSCTHIILCMYRHLFTNSYMKICSSTLILSNGGNNINICGDKHPHCPPGTFIYYHHYYAVSNIIIRHNIRLAYDNRSRFLIAFIVSDIALAPSSPMELLLRL